MFTRQYGDETTLISLNNGPAAVELHLPWERPMAEDALTRQKFAARSGALHITLPAENGIVLI